MAPTILHARTSFVDGLTFMDTSSNSFTFSEPTGSDPVALTAVLEPLVEAFYNTIPTGGSNALGAFMAQEVSRAAGASTTAWYDISASLGGALGSPIASPTWTLHAAGAGGAGNLPPGVAVTLGYRSAYGTDPEHGATASLPSSDQAIDEGAPASHTGVTRPKARDRGRIYFGPVTSGAVTVTSGTPGGTVDGAFKLNLIAAFKDLAAAVSAATPSSSLVVWSRRAAGVKPVAFLYVDEGSTYQRRREDDTLNRVHAWQVVSP